MAGSIGWKAIRKALHTWCVAGSGLAAASVIWAYPAGPRPIPPYIKLSIDDSAAVGRQWKVRDGDPNATTGLVKRLYQGHRTATLSLQCFAEEKADSDALGALERVTTAIDALEIHIGALNAAGVGIGKADKVRLVAGRINSQLEPRAVVEVELHFASELESYVQYADRVQVTTTLTDIEVDLEQWIPDPPA